MAYKMKFCFSINTTVTEILRINMESGKEGVPLNIFVAMTDDNIFTQNHVQNNMPNQMYQCSGTLLYIQKLRSVSYLFISYCNIDFTQVTFFKKPLALFLS